MALSPVRRRWPESAPTWAALLVVLAAGGAVHGATVWRNLPRRHWEDGRYVRHNRDNVHTLADCFTKPTAWPGGNEASYRPLSTSLYYWTFRELFEDRLPAQHAFNAAVYLGNGLLLFLVCRELARGWWSLVPPALFVSRRAHIQVVTYTSEFSALAYTGLTLAALALFLRARRTGGRVPEALALLAFALALLCKESALVWPALLLAWGWFFDRPSAWRSYVAPWMVLGLWAFEYPRILAALYPPGVPGYELDASPAGVLTRIGAYLLSFANVLVPAVDPERRGFAMPPPLVGLAGSRVMMTLTALGAGLAAVVAVRARRTGAGGLPLRVAGCGLAWFLIALAPFFVLADRLFMRYGYLAHAGLAVAVGGLALAAEHRIDARLAGDPRRASVDATTARAPLAQERPKEG